MTPLAAALLETGAAVAVVASRSVGRAIADAVPGVEVIAGALDRGLRVTAGAMRANPEATLPLLRESLAAPDEALRAAVVAWAPDVLVADATPWAPRLAQACGARSVLCSNFSWDDQYEAIFGATEEVLALREVVRGYDLGLVMPFGPGLPSVAVTEPAPLISRVPATSPTAVRAALHVPAGAKLITWAMGRTPAEVQPEAAIRAIAAVAARWRAAFAASEAVVGPLGIEGLIAVPDDASFVDLVASSDLVISKAGYSTVVETLRGPGRVIVLTSIGTAEERGLAAEVERREVGAVIEVGSEAWLDRLGAAVEALLALPPRAPDTTCGERWIAERVLRLAAEG